MLAKSSRTLGVMRKAICIIGIVFVAATGQPKPLVLALGDSITYGYGLQSPGSENYAALYAASIGGRIDDLASPGYTCEDVLKQEVPHMQSGAAVVIINCGTNDVGGFDFTPPAKVTQAPAATESEFAAAERAFAQILAQVRKKEPAATIYLVNLRHWQRISATETPQVAQRIDEWNAMLLATHERVVDVSNDPRMYERRYLQHDGLHPNAAGHKIIMSLFR
jgi:lysophospholipase L1-like esterase